MTPDVSGIGLWLQQSFPSLASPMQAVSVIDLGIIYILLVTALYIGFSAGAGLRAGLLLGISSGLNDAIKILVHQPRPYWIDARIEGLTAQSSFGMPSTQAQLAGSVYLYIAYVLKNYQAWAVAAFFIVLTGFSRIFLGAHDIIQVLCGFAIGTVILALFITLDPVVTPALAKQSSRTKVLIGFIGSVALILITLSALSLTTAGWTVPAEWNATAFASAGKPISPLNPVQTFSSAGLIFGLSTGYIVLSARGGYSAGNAWQKRITACIIALVAVYFLSGFLDGVITLFPRTLLVWLVYLKMTIVGFFFGYFLPLLLIRTGIGTRAESG
jgi:membrane-associated phospholipid phosphatase